MASIEGLWWVGFKNLNNDLFGSAHIVCETQRILGGDAQYTIIGEYKMLGKEIAGNVKVSPTPAAGLNILGQENSEFTAEIKGVQWEEADGKAAHVILEADNGDKILMFLQQRFQLR